MNIANYIEHTILAADATESKIKKLCEEAKQNHFKAICVNSCWVPYCVKELYGSGVEVGCVVGFPLGAMATEAKVAETEYVIDNGADEVDMVINIGWLKDNKDNLVKNDIQQIKKACNGKVLKVIIETCLLTQEEKIRACTLVKEAGADFVKTSTGFSKAGATVEDVLLMRETVGKDFGIKAAGGIRDYETAKKMIEAGADRLGCSAGIAIVQTATESANDKH